MRCGYNDDGQLGMGDYYYRKRFTEICEIPRGKIYGILCGVYNTYIKLNGGILMCTGKPFAYMNEKSECESNKFILVTKH